MPALSYGVIFLQFGQEKQTSTSDFAGAPLGTKGVLPDGREFRYAFSGEAIGAGELCQVLKIDLENDQDNVITTGLTDVRTITVSAVSNNVVGTSVIDFFKGGYIIVNDGAGEGHLYHIEGHVAFASDTVAYVFRTQDDVIREALASGTSLGGWVRNPYKDVELWEGNGLASNSSAPLGIAPTEIANDGYFWLQTKGPAMAKYTTGGSQLASSVPGRMVQASIRSSGVDGAISVFVAGSSGPGAGVTAASYLFVSENATAPFGAALNLPIIGVTWGHVSVDTDYQLIMLDIPGA